MDFCRLTEELWRVYLCGDAGEKQKMVSEWLDEDCVIIGTGAHEFYTNKQDFYKAMSQESEEVEEVSFRFENLRCRERKTGEDACLVYGVLYIRGSSADGKVQIDMDSRYSVLYERRGDRWKIVHIHQSMPNLEQREGEYYPKTLTEQVQKAQEEAGRMALLAQRDGLTGLINYHTFEEIWKKGDRTEKWLFIVDLDDFKKINDTYGHMEGHQVLKTIAGLLNRVVRTHDLVCRMGGDEFLLLCGGISSMKGAARLAERIVDCIAAHRTEKAWPSISVGGTEILPDEKLESAIERADKALYSVKRTTKNGYRIE